MRGGRGRGGTSRARAVTTTQLKNFQVASNAVLKKSQQLETMAKVAFKSSMEKKRRRKHASGITTAGRTNGRTDGQMGGRAGTRKRWEGKVEER
jgi:hypothetical protein